MKTDERGTRNLYALCTHIFSFFFFFFETGSCYVAQADWELKILRPQTPEWWDYKHVPPRPSLAHVFQWKCLLDFLIAYDLLSRKRMSFSKCHAWGSNTVYNTVVLQYPQGIGSRFPCGYKIFRCFWVPVAHACNPTYSWARDQKDRDLEASPSK
jgi:hypothetical protein